MGLFALFDRHAALVGRMTDTLGIDLVEAAQRGEMAEENVRSAVYACTGCTETSACADWVDAHGEGAAAAPAYCRNKPLFDRLSR